MFGYVRLDRMEAKGREYEYYRGVYCGLCRALGKCGGQCARLTLQYDITFLALVRLALEKHEVRFGKRRCVAHPFRKHTEAKKDDAIDFCAYASLILSYQKVLDDKKDERGTKRLLAGVAKPFFGGMSRRARKKFADLNCSICERLAALSDFEASGEKSIDKPAALFGEVMSYLLSYGLEGTAEKLGRVIGLNVGKWIYLADAVDDFEEDIKKRRYNPIAAVYGEEPDASVWKTMRFAMTEALVEAEKAFDLLTYSDEDMRGVVRNIIYVGMPTAADEILTEKEKIE